MSLSTWEKSARLKLFQYFVKIFLKNFFPEEKKQVEIASEKVVLHTRKYFGCRQLCGLATGAL
jgi:hypothetical protein